HLLPVQRVEALVGSAAHHHDLITPGGGRAASWHAAPDMTLLRGSPKTAFITSLIRVIVEGHVARGGRHGEACDRPDREAAQVDLPRRRNRPGSGAGVRGRP